MSAGFNGIGELTYTIRLLLNLHLVDGHEAKVRRDPMLHIPPHLNPTSPKLVLHTAYFQGQ